MYKNSTFTIWWYDIEDCTLRLSVDGGINYSVIAANVITQDVPANRVIDENGYERIYCSYLWTVPDSVSASCFIKYIDNSDASEIIGNEFSIDEVVIPSQLSVCVGMAM